MSDKDPAPSTAMPTGMVLISSEPTRRSEVKAARERMVTGVTSLIEGLRQTNDATTADGRLIFRGSSGRQLVDRVENLSGGHTVAFAYGEPGLHVGQEDGRDVVRLIEQDEGGVTVSTVKGEDELSAAIRGGKWGQEAGGEEVAHVGYERFTFAPHPGGGGELVTTESWGLAARSSGDSEVRLYPDPTDPSTGRTVSIFAGEGEYRQATDIVERVRTVALGG